MCVNTVRCSNATDSLYSFIVVVLTDESIGRIAGCLGNVYFRMALILHVPTPYINQLEHTFRDDLFCLNFEVLARWRDNNMHVPNMTKEPVEALRSLGLNDVVETVRDGECDGFHSVYRSLYIICNACLQ